MPGKRSAGEAELHEVGWRSPRKKGLSTCPTRQQLNEALLSAVAHTTISQGSRSVSAQSKVLHKIKSFYYFLLKSAESPKFWFSK